MHSTPLDSNAVYVTNYGEIVYDSATPDLLRFVDYSSRVDIISFKSQFTNYSGTQQPTFTLQMYEADDESGPWLKSEISSNSSAIFLTNSKKYIKIELEIFSEEEDVEALGLLLFINVLIHEPTVPVLSDSSRTILSRFPTWTALYEDSLDSATPELATPASTGAKFVNSLIGEYLDSFNTELDLNSINSYISTADEDAIDWLYITYNAPAAGIDILGDSVPLARSSSLENFYSSKKTDYIYYHNLADNQIITLRKFDNLTIDGSLVVQQPILFFNIFDEFGARVGLKRLFLENNENYKNRILDVYQNIPSVDADSIKKTLRRELDIWRAYGSTPDSNYLGATPEILEIEDIESSTPYFSFSGVPEKEFINFVKSINENYPSNFGYINWEEGIWDYAGLNYEGINTVPFKYDVATPVMDYFQPGVGDFSDVKVFVNNDSFSTVSFEGYFKADGFKVSSYEDVYAPIKILYEYYGNYGITIPDPDANNPDSSSPDSNGGVSLVYELHLKSHNQYATPSIFYKNFSYLDREDFIVKNYFSQNSPASPEFNYIPVFNSDGLTDPNFGFLEKTFGYEYENTDSTPRNQSIFIEDVNTVKIINKAQWDAQSQNYTNASNANYRVSFNEHQSGYTVNPPFATEISIASPNINYINANFKIGSTVYGTKQVFGNSNIIQSEIVINKDNDISSMDDEIISVQELKNSLVYPIGSTPQNIYVNNIKVDPSPLYKIASSTEVVQDPSYGGRSLDPYTNAEYFIPSSPNIVIESYNGTDISGPPDSSAYFESSTINYSSNIETLVVTTGLSATPYYPFKKPVWSMIGDDEAKSTPMIFGYLDRFGNAYEENEQMENSGRSPNPTNVDSFVGKYNLTGESFGITSQQAIDSEYLLTNINPVSLNENVVLTSSKNSVASNTYSPDTLIDVITEEFNSSIMNFTYSPISVDARPSGVFENKSINIFDVKQPDLSVGWLYLPSEDYYVYAKPILEIYNGRFFEIDIQEVPSQGAPILITSYNEDATVEYREAFFNDSSTPGNITFYNEETVVGSDDLALYLSYENVSDIYIQDSFSGSVLVQSPLNPEFWIWTLIDEDGNYILNLEDTGTYYISTLNYIQSGEDFYYLVSNRFQILDSVTHQSQIVPGREYVIRYKVSNAFYAERNDKKIYLSSTPSLNSEYHIVYESSKYLESTPSGLSLSSLDNPIDEGYIYVSDTEYQFDTASVWVSPQKISNNEDDIIYVSIISYDINGNPKPYQTFRVFGENLMPEDEYITTNNNGFAKTSAKFDGEVNSTIITLNIQGVSYPNPNADRNSSSGSFFQQFEIDLVKNSEFNYKLKAVADRINVRANAIDDIYIKGYIRQGANSPATPPIIYWRKARTAYEALVESDYSIDSSTPGRYGLSGTVEPDEYGNFIIGPFYSQDRTDPGLWFVAVDTEMSSTPSANPVTIYGDIVYWFENYDNIHYSNEPVPLPRFYTTLPLSGTEIVLEGKFTYTHHDQEYDATPAATPEIGWTPPRWFPISRYEQYQMGLLGSTPNFVSTFDNMNNDYEDS